MSEKNNITRKEALKKMGGLALGSTVLSTLAAPSAKSKSPFPNIITNRTSDRPNILWITAEGVPISVLSSYQNTRWGDLRSSLVDTPNIDRIAREGMQFQNSFCTNALCAPSRATLLTGKYDHENGVTANINANYGNHPSENKFDASQQTFPKIMQSHDYQTALMGKWHIRKGDGKPVNPAKAGFDKFAFKTGAGGPYYNPNGYLQNPDIGSSVIEKKSHKGYITDNFTDMAIQTMKQFNGRNKPFLMMMQYFSDHRPFNPPHKYEDLYKGRRIPEPSTFWDDYKHRSTAAEEARMRIDHMPDWDTPEDLTLRQRKQYNYQKLMKHFLGTLKAQDDNIGRLLNYLDQAGLADNTIVVYTSDHGFFLGEHGWFDKRFMYDPSLRMPFIIRYPKEIQAGSTIDDIMLNIDFAPTFLDYAGVQAPRAMQGRSFRANLRGQTPDSWRTALYYRYWMHAQRRPAHFGIRTRHYALMFFYGQPLTPNGYKGKRAQPDKPSWDFYDLQKDPREMHNIYHDPKYQDTIKHLKKQLLHLKHQAGDTLIDDEHPAMQKIIDSNF
jgi:arylsulfatase A-like enzyme